MFISQSTDPRRTREHGEFNMDYLFLALKETNGNLRCPYDLERAGKTVLVQSREQIARCYIPGVEPSLEMFALTRCIDNTFPTHFKGVIKESQRSVTSGICYVLW